MEKSPNFSLNPILKGLHIGYCFDERFEILSNPVRRSHSFAFKVRDLETQEDKVVLLIPEVIRHDSEALQYLTTQCEILTLLNHDGIARFFKIHTEGRYAFFELEYVAGHSFKALKLKKPEQRFTEEEVKWIADQVLAALEHAHNQNILHRDLKPANILLTPQRTIKLIDFGLSEPIRHALNLVQDTAPSTMILYWSPEQVAGKALTVRSDLYALGAVIYDLLSGKPPFFTGDVYNCILHQKPEPIEHVSGFMNEVILTALAKNPEDRYQNCDEMRQALAATGLSYRASAPPTAQAKSRQAKSKKQRPWQTMLLKPNVRYSLLSALMIVLLAFFIARLNFKSEPQQAFSAKDSLNLKQENAQPDSFKIRMLNALLQQASQKISRGEVFEPEDNNALFLLKQAQKINPHDALFLKLKQRAIDFMAQQAQKAVLNNQANKAMNIVNIGLEYFPQSEQLMRLRDQIQKGDFKPLHIKIEILNGAGKTGIAKKLKNYLERYDFKVVNSENYRTAGQVNWNVSHSQFRGHLAKDPYIEKLEKLLGLPYQQQEVKFQSAAANISIVLGRDFNRLPPFNQ